MNAYELKNVPILTLWVDYMYLWFILWGGSKNKAFIILNNSVLEDKGVL